MNSIEMSDIDGDALTITSRGSRAWISCTSGLDEVTVGPFPTRVLRRAVLSEPDVEDEAVFEHLVSLGYRKA